MYIHEEVQLAVLPILAKHAKDGLTVNDLIAEMNHAAWCLSSLNERGIQMLRDDLNKKVRGAR